MKITFKRPLYITLDLHENRDRGQVTQVFKQVLDPEFSEFVSSIRTRSSVQKSLSEQLRTPVSVSFSDRHKEVKMSIENNFTLDDSSE